MKTLDQERLLTVAVLSADVDWHGGDADLVLFCLMLFVCGV